MNSNCGGGRLQVERAGTSLFDVLRFENAARLARPLPRLRPRPLPQVGEVTCLGATDGRARIHRQHRPCHLEIPCWILDIPDVVGCDSNSGIQHRPRRLLTPRGCTGWHFVIRHSLFDILRFEAHSQARPLPRLKPRPLPQSGRGDILGCMLGWSRWKPV